MLQPSSAILPKVVQHLCQDETLAGSGVIAQYAVENLRTGTYKTKASVSDARVPLAADSIIV